MQKKYLLFSVFVLGLLFFSSPRLSGQTSQSVTLAWNPSPNSNVLGYVVYYGSASGSYSTSTNVPNQTSARMAGLQPGQTYYFAVTARNSLGVESPPSNEVSYQVPVTTLPVVALTAPLNGAAYTAPALVTIAANVTANGHTITKVQFYNGTTFLGEDTSSPYSLTWSGMGAGSYSFMARVVYDAGSTADSARANVTVTNASTLPTIALTSPVGGATYAAPANINFSASVTANGHTITKVQFYNGATLLGEDTSSPYSYAWSGVSAGSYSLKARAVYDSGSTVDSTTASVAVTNNPAPLVALTSPGNGATYPSPATINLAASVTANGHTINKIQFYNGATLLGEDASSPYSLAWSNVAAGSYSLIARAVYDSGSTADSAAINVTALRAGGTLHYDFTYADRASMLADGWDFLARSSAGTARNTEQTSGAVVSYDQLAHPGVLRIPADVGDLWMAANDTRNSLLRDLPADWTSIRVKLSFAPTQNYQQASIVAYQDDDNYLQVTREYNSGNYVTFVSETGGSPITIQSAAETATANLHLRLDRDAATATFSAYYSLNGSTWTALGTATRTLSSPRLAIIVGTSPGGYPNADLAWAEIMSPQAITPLPAPWQSANIGNVALAGSATGSNGLFTVQGSGNIASTADSFRFVYQPLSGDGDITARINSMATNGVNRCVGVMIRESLAPNSKNVFMGVGQNLNFRWQRRSNTGGNTASTTGDLTTPPDVWTRLVRSKTTLYGYNSTNGVNWTRLTSVRITMATNIYVGFVVASGDTNTLNTSVFSNVSVTP